MITTLNTTDTFVADGVSQNYAFTMYCYDPSWIKITVDGIPANPNVAVNLDQATNPGGTISFAIDAIPGAGATVVVTRVVPLTQETAYRPYDSFPALSHERALDKLTAIAQQIAENVGGITLPIPATEVTSLAPIPLDGPTVQDALDQAAALITLPPPIPMANGDTPFIGPFFQQDVPQGGWGTVDTGGDLTISGGSPRFWFYLGFLVSAQVHIQLAGDWAIFDSSQQATGTLTADFQIAAGSVLLIICGDQADWRIISLTGWPITIL